MAGRADGDDWVAIESKGPDPPTVAQVIGVGSKTIRDNLWKDSEGSDLVELFKELSAELKHRRVNPDKLKMVANVIKSQLPYECPTPADMRQMVFGIYEGGFSESVPELLSPPTWTVEYRPRSPTSSPKYCPRSPTSSPTPSCGAETLFGDTPLLALE